MMAGLFPSGSGLPVRRRGLTDCYESRASLFASGLSELILALMTINLTFGD